MFDYTQLWLTSTKSVSVQGSSAPLDDTPPLRFLGHKSRGYWLEKEPPGSVKRAKVDLTSSQVLLETIVL